LIVKEILTAKEVAAILKLNKITVYKYANEGKIPGVRIGNRWRFDRSQIEDLMAGSRSQVIPIGLHRVAAKVA
jgi:excisionase family DNA binding protein